MKPPCRPDLAVRQQLSWLSGRVPLSLSDCGDEDLGAADMEHVKIGALQIDMQFTITALRCRVPDECPPQVMSLYIACTALNPQHRPTAFELMDTLAKCIAMGRSP